VFINGGPGIDTIVVIGTPIADTFIITDTYIAGAGRIVSFVGVEAVEVDGGGGDDQIYVLSTGLKFETIVDGGSGNDTIHVGGTPPTLVFDPPPFTYTPPAFEVPLPPELVWSDAVTWDLSGYTFSVDLGTWLAHGGPFWPDFGDPAASAAAGRAIVQEQVNAYAAALSLWNPFTRLSVQTLDGV